MAVTYIGEGQYRGLSGDTKPTTGLYAGATFFETDTRVSFVWTGTGWTSRLTVISQAISGSAEVMASWTIGDTANASKIDFVNASGTNGVLAPWMRCFGLDDAAHPALYLYGYIGNALDTGTQAVIRLDARKADNSAVTTRPLLSFRNAGTEIFAISNTAFAFAQRDLTNIKDITANGLLNINKTAVGSSAESIASFKVADASGYIQINNGVSTDAKFIPNLRTYNIGAGSTLYGFAITSYIAAADDSGTAPILIFDIRRDDEAALTARPLVDVRNVGASRFKINVKGDPLVSVLASSGAGELLERWQVSDNATAYIQLQNASATNNVLVPQITAYNWGASASNHGLVIRSYTDDADDSGTAPVMVFDVRRDDEAAFGTRTPVFRFRNASTTLLDIAKDGSILQLVTAQTGVAENLHEWRPNDVNTYLRAQNSTVTDGRYEPMFTGRQVEDAGLAALRLMGRVEVAHDTGAVPVMIFDMRRHNDAALTTRPLLDIRNAGTIALRLTPTTLDLTGKQLVNLAIQPVFAAVFKVGSTYFAQKYDGTIISSNTTLATILVAAIDACNAAGGGVVRLLEGTYSTLTTQLIIKPNVILEGEGIGVQGHTVLQFGPLTTTGIKIQDGAGLRHIKVVGDISTLQPAFVGELRFDGDHIDIEDVWWSNMSYGFNMISLGAPYSDNCRHIHVKRVRFDNIKSSDDWAACLHMIGPETYDVHIDGVEGLDCNRGVEIEVGAHDIYVDNGRLESVKNFVASGDVNWTLDVHCHDAEEPPYRIYFKNWYLKDTRSFSAQHAGSGFADADMPHDIYFENITVDTANAEGFLSGFNLTAKNIKYVNVPSGRNCINLSQNIKHVLIDNAEVDTLHTTSLFLQNTSGIAVLQDVTVRNCKVTCNDDKDMNGHYVLRINSSAARDITIENNTFLNAKSWSAIAVYTNPSKITIKDNKIEYAASNPALYGIWASCSDSQIHGNRFSGNVTTAHIVLRDSSATRIDVSRNVIPSQYIWVRNTVSNCNLHDNIFAISNGISFEATQNGNRTHDNVGWLPAGTAERFTETVGASPYVFTNTYPYPVQVQISGGTVSQVRFSPDGGTNYYIIATTTSQFLLLQQNDMLEITYSSIPIVRTFPVNP